MHWDRGGAIRTILFALVLTVAGIAGCSFARQTPGESGAVARPVQTRAAVLEINPDGSGMRVFAYGLRNPVGMAWEPVTNTLWTVVNERDALGDQLVPDYATQVCEGAFYGWPYSYFGKNEDPRKKGQRPDLVAKAIAADYGLGAHTASLGLAFCTGTQFPAKYRGGATSRAVLHLR